MSVNKKLNYLERFINKKFHDKYYLDSNFLKNIILKSNNSPYINIKLVNIIDLVISIKQRYTNNLTI